MKRQTLYELITEAFSYTFYKHELEGEVYPTVDDYVASQLDQLSRREFLKRISDALDEMLKEPRHD